MTPLTYIEFLKRKIPQAEVAGFEPVKPLNDALFEWQKPLVTWAVRRGRAALFEDCGLGKTIQQLEWATQVIAKTGKPVLILAPNNVTHQTPGDGAKFGYKVTRVKHAEELDPTGINITNYERLDLFLEIIPQLGGVVLDESSILKSFNGKTRQKLTEVFKYTPYRLACTATPSPNDFTELGQHADFLGICSPAEMLATYFINDTFDTGTWRLKGHAEEEFWRWVSTWAACVSKPSDIGFSDEGFELPALNIIPVFVDVDETGMADGELLHHAELSATTFNQEMKRTIKDRVAKSAELVAASDDKWAVWCNLNDEQDALEDALGTSAVSVRGSDRDEWKIKRELLWREEDAKTMVSKGSIFGYGSNWQHCHKLILFPTYSFEDFYQIIRRFWRFGQKQAVDCYVVVPRTAQKILRVLNRKSDQHEKMRALMQFTRENISENTRDSITTMNKEIKVEGTENWIAYHGDCVRVAKSRLEDNSIGFSVFSPPFADLFTYSNDIQDMGNCRGLESFMEQFQFLIEELKRVTMPGRHVAVHCCDLLSTKWKDGEIGFKNFADAIERAFCGDPDDIISQVSSALMSKVTEKFKRDGWVLHSKVTIWKDPVTEMQRTKAHGLLYKTLQSDSSKSRVGAPDYLLVFRKPGENPKPITHTPGEFPLSLWQEVASPYWRTIDQGNVLNGEIAREDRDERHICPLQLDVINRALTLWSAPDDLVFSPFMGIGSEGYCAVKMGRRFVGAELKESYWDRACTFLRAAEQELHQDLFRPQERVTA